MSTNAVLPEQQEQTTAPASAGPEIQTFGIKNRKLPEQLKDAISEAFRTLQARDIYDRRIEVLKDRMHRFYDDGVQHFYPNYATGAFQIGTAGSTVSVGGQDIECPDYLGAYNIFYPYGRSLDAVLTQNPPGIDFQPDDPSRAEDTEASETAEGYRHYFDRANDVKEIQQKISRMFRLSGRTVLRVCTKADAQKWGLNEAGKPRQMEVCEVYGTLESKTPIVAKSQEECAYTFLYTDPDVLVAKGKYSWIASKIKGGQAGIGENEWERFARLGVQQARKGYFLTGQAGAHITTKIEGYLRPCVWSGESYTDIYNPNPDEDPEFDSAKSVNEDGEPLTVGEKLEQVFPEGCYATYIGQNYAESENVSLDDAITIGFPKERDGMTGGAMMADLVVIQDVFNDYKNAERSAYEKGWPSLWVRAEDAEYDAIMEQKAEPFAIRQLKSTNDAIPLAEHFYREPDMDLSATFVAEIENLSGPLAQQITGALPSLQGENDPDNKTATGKAIDRSQAMGMLGMPWANMKRLFARMYYQAALLAAKNPDHAKEIIVPGNGRGANMTLRLERLTKGKFSCHPDTDSSFPESTAAKRANLQQVVTLAAKSPIGQQFFASPDNWEEMVELLGFPQLVLVPAEAYKKQVRELELLLRESPVPPDPQLVEQMQIQHAAAGVIASQTGQPIPPFTTPPPTSSVPVQPDDYHDYESAKCKEWLSSEECWRQQAEGNLPGIENVRLHKAAHDQFIQQAAMQAAAMQQQMKPPSEAINFKDLPPAGQQQEAAQAGIHIAPEVAKNAAPPGAPGTATV